MFFFTVESKIKTDEYYTSIMQENPDSPFHSAVESDLDRIIKSVKEMYVTNLRTDLLAMQEISSVELTHTPLSPYICLIATVKQLTVAIRLLYDIDKHTFENIKYLREGASYVNNDVILSDHPEARDILLSVMVKCLDANKMIGLGTKYGGIWLDAEDSTIIAKTKLYEIEKTENHIRNKKRRDLNFLFDMQNGF